ncbi:hypothetical protein ONZ45_g2727 [Pleurotus djamor]|nr:hypothetical protein ONZ45_g2727 [Pleurotus djamor]
METLNQTYLLHRLAVEPDAVLPPGKSLVAMLARMGGRDGKAQTDLHRTVEGILHKAFWDEATETLSSPEPATQLARLKLLYSDLANTLSPLLPHKHRVLISLSSPIPPTSAPLQSALIFLKEILLALKERCAPARDDEVLQIIQRIDEFNPSYPHEKLVSEDTKWTPLADLIVTSVKSIITLAEHMKSDLDQFKIGSLSEPQLKVMIVREAKVRERGLVSDLWTIETTKGDVVLQRLWHQWMERPLQPYLKDLLGADDERHEGLWVLHLVQALGSTAPISCNLPGPASSTTIFPVSSSQLTSTVSHTNDLPPQFLLSSPTLFYLQNLLQALVIAAVLRSLTRLPPTGMEGGFMERVWSLLKSEIDEPDNGTESTKAINLEDEVVRARTLAVAGQTSNTSQADATTTAIHLPSLEPEEEKRLRDAVQRTLRPNDPVFVLLQKRLLASMAKHLLGLTTTIPKDPSNSVHPHRRGDSIQAPAHMQTGRARQIPPASPLSAAFRSPDHASVVDDPSGLHPAAGVTEIAPIRGFEDPVLSRAVADACTRVFRCIEWVKDTWINTTSS